MNEKPRTEKKIDENPSEENMFLNHWRLQTLFLITSSYENQTEPIPA